MTVGALTTSDAYQCSSPPISVEVDAAGFLRHADYDPLAGVFKRLDRVEADVTALREAVGIETRTDGRKPAQKPAP